MNTHWPRRLSSRFHAAPGQAGLPIGQFHPRLCALERLPTIANYDFDRALPARTRRLFQSSANWVFQAFEVTRARFDAYWGEAESLIREVATLPRTHAEQGYHSLQTGKFRQAKGECDHTDHSKRAPFEAGLRTPILFHLPGRTVPATHEAAVSSVDIMPTILAATGANLPDSSLPGVNPWPVATGQSIADDDRVVFGELYPGDARELGKPGRDIAYRWVRRERYKLIVPYRHGVN